MNNTDRFEKSVLLPAPRERVWRAVSLAENFGSWFGADFAGPFVAGTRVSAAIEPTSVDPEIARMQQPYAGKPFDLHVVEVRPMEKFSFRWHPYAGEDGVDYSAEPMTLIEFELGDAEGGTLLRISESGFDQLPLARRKEAYAAEEGGWAAQCGLVKKYLALHPQL
ncbi:MAG: SRPBCC family protein [Proteobacteria bacterium]|nr:SRPBCC family protein [Pseudomonadota bacterium]